MLNEIKLNRLVNNYLTNCIYYAETDNRLIVRDNTTAYLVVIVDDGKLKTSIRIICERLNIVYDDYNFKAIINIIKARYNATW